MLTRAFLASLAFTAGVAATATAYAATDSVASDPGAASRGKAFNPDISMNFLGLYRRSNLGDDAGAAEPNGLLFQEAELAFASDVDPYFRANGIFSFSREGEEFGVEPEELYFETLALPVVTLKAGKFYAAFGRHNQTHTHAFPFIDAPLIHQRVLGPEGLNDVGVSASALLPFLPWFGELTVQAFQGENENLFHSPSPNDAAGVARLKNLWDLSDDLTLEAGLNATGGANAYGTDTTAWLGDLTFRWRPSEGGKYHSLIFSTEYLDADRRGNPDGERLAGLASWVQYQFAERWWAQARGEWVGTARSEGIPAERRQSALIAFAPSEFSLLRAQYDRHTGDALGRTEHRVTLQYNISIGAHPAHAY
jgi:hypothetical protein